MSSELIVNVTRGASHTQVLSNVPCRIVELSPLVVAGLGGAIPYNSYEFFSCMGTPDIRQGDMLIDTVSGDKYRVSGNPSVKDYSYVKVLLEKIVGVTP